MTQPVFRFAPSPNGRLHIGHAYSALVNQRLARETGGRLLLRIDNIDTVRCTPVLEQRMLEDLEWLGLRFDGENRRQSEHAADYRAAIAKLERMGLVYPAFMSRGEVRSEVEAHTAQGHGWPCDPDGVPHYPPGDRAMAEAERDALLGQGAGHALRLNMPAALNLLEGLGARALHWQEEGAGPGGKSGMVEADPGQWGDFMLSGRDASAAYHLACVVDDAIQGVTHVVRGRDLFFATSAHRLLQAIMDLPEPVYFHHDLVLDADGRKLSKSRGDTSIAELRAAGVTPRDIVRMAGLDSD